MNFSTHYPELIESWRAADSAWAVKDQYSRYLYANSAFYALLNLPAGYQLEGRSDAELPTAAAEFHAYFVLHDQLVAKQQQRVSALSCQLYGTEPTLQPVLVDKYPYLDEHAQLQGVILQAKKIAAIYPIFYLQQCVKKHFILSPPSELFTPREWQLVFLMSCGLRNHEIAKVLQLSVRTVENRMQQCFDKLAASCRQDFLHKCIQQGWSCYLPRYFMHKKHLLLA